MSTSKEVTGDAVVAQSERVILRPVTLDDVGEEYLKWMRDPEVTQYLESCFTSHTIENLREYVSSVSADKDTVFMAIMARDSGRHIGNIKLGPINRVHSFGDVGILIGNKSYWGKGYATETIRLLTDYAFTALGLHKLTAGAYANNLGSVKAFIKAGWEQEGLRKNQCLYGDKYVDLVFLGVVRPE